MDNVWRCARGPNSLHGTWSSIDEQQRCSSVRAKRGGALTGPNPTGSGKLGTKYHVVVAADGLPLGAIPSAADVHDTRLFPHRLHLALAVGAAAAKLHADAGCDGTDNRRLCLDQGIQPYMRRIGEAHGSGLGRARSVAERGCAWLLADKRLGRRQNRLGRVIPAFPTAACIFITASRISAF
jgi:hypothetical protein